MLRKGGLTIGTIAKILLVVLILSISMTTIMGPVLQDLLVGLNKNEDLLNQVSATVEVEKKETLADAAIYVWDRAQECDEVEKQRNNGGYIFLRDTALSIKPHCSGKPAGPTRQAPFFGEEILQGGGNDMEGVYSRVNFEVKKDFTLRSLEYMGSADGNHGGHKFKMITAARGGIDDWLRGCQKPNLQPSGRYDFTVFFDVNPQGRIKKNGGLLVGDAANQKDVSNAPYCEEKEDFGTIPFTNIQLKDDLTPKIGPIQYAKEQHNKGGSITVQFCEGDGGYIQVNKKEPTRDDEVEDTWGGDDYFAFIQVTKLGSCSN